VGTHRRVLFSNYLVEHFYNDENLTRERFFLAEGRISRWVATVVLAEREASEYSSYRD